MIFVGPFLDISFQADSSNLNNCFSYRTRTIPPISRNRPLWFPKVMCNSLVELVLVCMLSVCITFGKKGGDSLSVSNLTFFNSYSSC